MRLLALLVFGMRLSIAAPGSRDAAVAVARQAQWSDADFRWLDTWRDAAFDALMPLKARDGQAIAYRRYRDLYPDVAELSFSVTLAERPRGHAIAATLIEPGGPSIQEQLLRLHAAEREAPLQSLLPRVSLRRSRLANRSCSALDAQLRSVPRFIPAAPVTDAIPLHPVIHRIVINTALLQVDATLLDPRTAVARWADRVVAAIRACGTVTPPS